MKKRILSIVLAICLVLTLVPTIAFAGSVSHTVTVNAGEGGQVSTDGTSWSNSVAVTVNDGETLNGKVQYKADEGYIFDGVVPEIVSVAAGSSHTVLLDADGNVWTAGLNDYGQLGRDENVGTDYINPTFTQVTDGISGVKITAIAAGYYHTVLLDEDGNVWTAGSNYYGQLGRDENAGTTKPNSTFKQVTNGISGVKITAIVAGGVNTVLLGADGNVWTAGLNNHGQLGKDENKGTTNANPTFKQVTNGISGVKIKAIAADGSHTVLLDANGNVWTAGYNYYGQLGRNENVGTYNANPTFTKVTDGISGVKIKTIAAGNYHTVLLDENNNVWTAGRNNYGQLGRTDSNASTFTQVTDGISGVKITAIAARDRHTVLLDEDGNVWTAGDNYYGQLGRDENIGTENANPAFKQAAVNPDAITFEELLNTPINNDSVFFVKFKDIQDPVITGLENKKTYCDAVEFTVADNNGIASVKAGNTELTESNGKYTLEKGAGTVTVVATDKAKNETTITVTVNDGHTYGAWKSNGNDTHTRNCTVTGCNGYEDGNCEGGQATYFKKAVCDTCLAEYGELLTDTTAPNGEITVGTNKWNSLLNTITFGLFFKNTQSVAITATDDSYTHAGYTDDKAVKVEYYLHSGDTALTQSDLASVSFTAYNNTFSINPDNKYVVYARLTDHAGNVTYISSNGIVLDATAPIIKGLENGKTYCESQTVTITEDYIESVKVNGTEVTVDSNNQFTLNPAEGTQTIVVTDKAGNVSADITVTVNDGHTDNDKDHKCDFCGTTLSSHTGGTATCTAKAICEYCGKEYGEIDSSNHNLEKISANNATVTATGNKEYWHCKDCSKYFADENGTNEIKLDDTVIAKLPPEIIDGKGQSITEGESKELALRSNAAFSDFIRVELDGKTLDEKNYTATEGSTIVTLKADYVATLSVGEHTIGIVSASGTATTTFTINAKPVVETTVPTQTEPETTVPALTENSTTVPAQTENEATVSSQSENDSMTSPETGNDSETALLLAFLLSCGGAIVVTGAYSKRKKHSAK